VRAAASRWAVLVLVLGLTAAAWAQPRLAVNGVDVPGATTTLVPGVAYAPAAELAGALGADLAIDLAAGRVTLVLGAAVVLVDLVGDAGRAAALDPALTRDGVVRAGPAAVHDGVEAYVPVKAVGEAFGGRVAFLAESDTVAVVLPRPTLTARLEGRGSGERLVFRLDAPARIVRFESPSTDVLELRFERTDVDPIAFDGGAFVRASVAQVRGSAEVRVQLEPGSTARVLTVPSGSGAEVIVAFGAAPSPTAIAASSGRRLVLDAGHDATDVGFTATGAAEAELTRAFVDAVAESLMGTGIEVERTRPAAAAVTLRDRSSAGIGADAFVSIHAAPLPAGRGRVYVLDDASGSRALETAMRANAETALARPETDALRRALLLRLVPDLEDGRRLAASLSASLAGAGVVFDPVEGAPLTVLRGAAGRGVLLELSPEDLHDPGLPLALAAALTTALASIDR
jgi:N-acetylmuramoyl-L-alanine amidase